MNETDVKQMFATAVATPAPDRLDIDAAVHSGRRRRRVRVGATLGAALGVVVLAGAIVVTALPQRDTSPVVPATPTTGPVTSAAQLTGRWIADSIDGQDVTAFRDLGGNAIVATFGGTALPTSWEATGECSPVSGDFTVTPGGQFHAVANVGVVVFCPEVTRVQTYSLRAFTAATAAELTAAAGTEPATLTLLDGAHRMLARFHAYDKTAAQLCDAALGAGSVVSAGPITTAAQVRSTSGGPAPGTTQPATDAFPGFPYSSAAAYCWTGGNGTYTSYGVVEAGPSVKLATISGLTSPPSGPPTIR